MITETVVLIFTLLILVILVPHTWQMAMRAEPTDEIVEKVAASTSAAVEDPQRPRSLDAWAAIDGEIEKLFRIWREWIRHRSENNPQNKTGSR